jgi:hypothetical protein
MNSKFEKGRSMEMNSLLVEWALRANRSIKKARFGNALSGCPGNLLHNEVVFLGFLLKLFERLKKLRHVFVVESDFVLDNLPGAFFCHASQQSFPALLKRHGGFWHLFPFVSTWRLRSFSKRKATGGGNASGIARSVKRIRHLNFQEKSRIHLACNPSASLVPKATLTALVFKGAKNG